MSAKKLYQSLIFCFVCLFFIFVAQVTKMSSKTRELEDELASARQKCQEIEQQVSRRAELVD